MPHINKMYNKSLRISNMPPANGGSEITSQPASTKNKKAKVQGVKIAKIGAMFLVLFIILGNHQLVAQTYLQASVGLGWGRYAPYNQKDLDRNEHDVKYGAIIDVELGRKLKLKGAAERFSLSVGARLSYNLRAIKGIYTINRWEPDANINAHIYSVFLTLGTSMRISNKFSVFLQGNIGPSYIQWYQEKIYKDSFWVFYLPVDVGAAYKLKDDLSLTFGLNVQMPIYTGTGETIFLGIRKEF